MSADDRLAFQAGGVALSSEEKRTWETVTVFLFSASLCTCSVPLPVFLQHIINSVTACSKAPCLVVHIQSCRLKQIAICMPLGEKKQREAPFLTPPLHLAEYSLFWGSKSLPPPSCCDRQSRSNHSNQCLLVPSRLGSSCQNKRVSVQSLWWRVIPWC